MTTQTPTNKPDKYHALCIFLIEEVAELLTEAGIDCDGGIDEGVVMLIAERDELKEKVVKLTLELAACKTKTLRDQEISGEVFTDRRMS